MQEKRESHNLKLFNALFRSFYDCNNIMYFLLNIHKTANFATGLSKYILSYTFLPLIDYLFSYLELGRNCQSKFLTQLSTFDSNY